MLGGEVEVDEAYVPLGRKGRKAVKPRRRGGGRRKGRSTKRKTPFFTLVQRGSRRVIYVAAKRANKKTVASLLLRRVRRGSAVFTDEFKSYLVVGRLGYSHFAVNHSSGLYAVGPNHVNSCECYNWHLRSFLRSKWGVTTDRADFYASAASAFAGLYGESAYAACNWLIETLNHHKR